MPASADTSRFSLLRIDLWTSQRLVGEWASFYHGSMGASIDADTVMPLRDQRPSERGFLGMVLGIAPRSGARRRTVDEITRSKKPARSRGFP